MQGFILQGSFVDTGLKVFFWQSARLFLARERFFSCNLVRASARKGLSGERGSESGGMKGGVRVVFVAISQVSLCFFRQTWPFLDANLPLVLLGPKLEIPTDKTPLFKVKLLYRSRPDLDQICRG